MGVFWCLTNGRLQYLKVMHSLGVQRNPAAPTAAESMFQTGTGKAAGDTRLHAPAAVPSLFAEPCRQSSHQLTAANDVDKYERQGGEDDGGEYGRDIDCELALEGP